MMSKIKNNRVVSFVAVSVVYVIAAAVGALVYISLDTPWWLSLLVADIAATAVTFIFSLVFDNASVYDPYWSVQPPVILIGFACFYELTALGVLLIAAVLFWGIRLTANWAYTFVGLKHQDWRYTMLCEKTGKFYPIINFVGIHLVPTLVVYSCILPAVYAVKEGLGLTVGSVIFMLVSLGAALLQGVADIEMHKFRKARTGEFIRVGLWKYSRHPNYLGEILMWWGIGLSVACANPAAWYLCAGAVTNTLLFSFVSIPMADKRQSQKDGFAKYKLETRVLLPIKKHSRDNEKSIVNIQV